MNIIKNICLAVAIAICPAAATAQSFTLSLKSGAVVTFDKADVDSISFKNDKTIIPTAHVGDYYYSDGTWSGDLDTDKTVVGVVFWAGDPTADDPTLRRDHPECTNGLVLALSDINNIAWHNSYEKLGYYVCDWVKENAPEFEIPGSEKSATGAIQKIRGYNNTKAIEAYNAAEENADRRIDVVERLTSFRTENPAPEKSSGWYLPSPKELSLLCVGDMVGSVLISKPVKTNADAIDMRLQEIGATPITLETYWSSTELYNGSPNGWWTAWNYYFDTDMNNPVSYSFKGWSEFAHVRYVLAF